ncbi:MAG TPA: hypothetical protein VGI37_02585 [Streptosporangiaceae bacterium]|jgi:hypothetical protein
MGQSSPALETLVWTVKSWWGVQGVRSATRTQMARALAESVTWSPDLFGPVPGYGPDRAAFACEQVAEVAERSIATSGKFPSTLPTRKITIEVTVNL